MPTHLVKRDYRGDIQVLNKIVFTAFGNTPDAVRHALNNYADSNHLSIPYAFLISINNVSITRQD